MYSTLCQLQLFLKGFINKIELSWVEHVAYSGTTWLHWLQVTDKRSLGEFWTPKKSDNWLKPEVCEASSGSVFGCNRKQLFGFSSGRLSVSQHVRTEL